MKDFLKYTFASLLGNLLGLALMVTMGVGGLIFLVMAAATQDSGPQVKDKSVLVFDLSLNITDADPEYNTSELFQKALAEDSLNQIKLRTILEGLEKASQDDRIVGLYLKGTSNPTSTGLANSTEVRQALEKFKESGKPIIAYDLDWTEPEYYLASVANTIVVNPLGSVEMNGLSSEIMFLTGALEKFGIGVQVTRVGKYKSAVEPFLLKQMSSENREQTQKLLDDIWGKYITTVSPSRQLNASQLQQIADGQGILMAPEAVKSKLVDKVAHFDEVIVDLKKLTGEPEDEDKMFRQISINSYAKMPEVIKVNRGDVNSKNKIGIIYAEGSIVDGEGVGDQIGGDSLAKKLRKLRMDNEVKAVVLRVNSPGGSATASEIIGREVELLQAQKPVIVSMGNFAASGGYWISMAASQILAEANTITGSIGVFGVLFNIQDIANENGVTWDVVKTGRYANINTVSRPKTPEELARIQKVVDAIYERFLTKVSESRDLPKSKVVEIAQGRVWSGVQAEKIGLVDQIGGIQDAIAAAAEQAKLEDDWKLEEYPEGETFEQQILETFIGGESTQASSTLDPITLEFLKLREELAQLKALNDPRGIYTRLPFNLQID
ncbi:signal peptide peptidase SppA, 67K type [Lyngbya aestuarii BL J]|uniref:Protease 4 n=1 Tax=Lyngbya aestuarii BL J TaxID=1348334 RepID=U7QU80_9CYAN|nr:signal peptide peptidase SppA [Lyngbya aestuarii]ERT09971.1 signal peptide peptidase SppA, 67K type [Lyngbya aestuarii BL J]